MDMVEKCVGIFPHVCQLQVPRIVSTKKEYKDSD